MSSPIDTTLTTRECKCLSISWAYFQLLTAAADNKNIRGSCTLCLSGLINFINQWWTAALILLFPQYWEATRPPTVHLFKIYCGCSPSPSESEEMAGKSNPSLASPIIDSLFQVPAMQLHPKCGDIGTPREWRMRVHMRRANVSTFNRNQFILFTLKPCSLCSLGGTAGDEATVMYYLYNYGFTATKQIPAENPSGPGKNNFGWEFHFLFLWIIKYRKHRYDLSLLWVFELMATKPTPEMFSLGSSSVMHALFDNNRF